MYSERSQVSATLPWSGARRTTARWCCCAQPPATLLASFRDGPPSERLQFFLKCSGPAFGPKAATLEVASEEPDVLFGRGGGRWLRGDGGDGAGGGFDFLFGVGQAVAAGFC